MALTDGVIPVIVDPKAEIVKEIEPVAVDRRHHGQKEHGHPPG
jgi:hypothetical protein